MSQYNIALKPNKSFVVSMEVNGGTTDYNKLRNKPTINGVEVVGELTTEDLNIKIPDVSGFATKEELLGKADKSDIPTKTSQLENDSEFITELPSLEGYALKTDIPTKTSQLTNDKGFITSSSLSGYATTEYVNDVVNARLSVISNTLDTINGEIV